MLTHMVTWESTRIFSGFWLNPGSNRVSTPDLENEGLLPILVGSAKGCPQPSLDLNHSAPRESRCHLNEQLLDSSLTAEP